MKPAKLEHVDSTVIISDRFTRTGEHADQTRFPERLAPGTRVGPYLVISEVGGGGMGRVYQAQDTELDRAVALKVLPPNWCDNREYLARFRTEGVAQAQLNSPFVAVLHNMFKHPAGWVLVLEYLRGQTLKQRIQQHGPLSLEEARWIFDQALLGAEHAHNAGIVHCDLKPSNIFVNEEGQVKLMDFGVARLLGREAAGASGALMGTLLYIAPEQVNGRQVDYRADIYGLGICLYEALTGRLPFERRRDYALMHAHVQEAPPRPSRFRRLPRQVERIILKAIQKEPHKRFQNVAEFRLALMAALDSARSGWWRRAARPPAGTAQGFLDDPYRYSRPRERRRGGLGLDGALVAVILALGAALWLGPEAKETFSRWLAPEPAAAVKTAPPATDARYAPLRRAWGD